jgi:hypothetical protein
MDIAKYVGLYLLKNKYCCLQGLGNVEIKRTVSQHDGKELRSGSYYATLNPLGSIDDAFPNFVANNEQVSIAKASNEISAFIKESKAKMALGSSVVIPSVGQYVMKEHELHFELDAAFALPNHPLLFPMAMAAKPSAEEQKVKDEPSFETSINYNKHRTVNWNIVAFWGFIILIGAGIMAWGIRYFMNQQKASPTMVEQVENPSAPQTEVTVSNTSGLQSTDITVAAGNLSGNTSDTPSFKFIIKAYKTLAKAEKKQKQLFSYGYNVGVVNKDSSTFYVVNTIKLMPADTAKMKDSLSRMLNPNGVLIMK